MCFSVVLKCFDEWNGSNLCNEESNDKVPKVSVEVKFLSINITFINSSCIYII